MRGSKSSDYIVLSRWRTCHGFRRGLSITTTVPSRYWQTFLEMAEDALMIAGGEALNHSELKRVLYVEDEDDMRAVVQLVLEELGGLTVLACRTGQEALQRAADFAPDMILLDMMLPDMDGVAVLRALHVDSRLAETPVIFITAKVQSRDIVKFKALGVLDVVEKPFDPMMLITTISDIWNEHHK